ncbi:MAG: thiol oxidoreductase [Bdellovibrionaceae bacterium]|nr:thiol oxidoreductase [Pseudobdellovibrionaceae bacterium]
MKRLFAASLTFFALSAQADSVPSWINEIMLGGSTTVVIKTPTVRAYQNPLANLTTEEVERHLAGDALFEKNFSDDPTQADYGLGPAFNNINCAACHIRDGRGSLPVMDLSSPWTRLGTNESIFLRISIEDGAPRKFDHTDHYGAPIPVPGFSDQLFHNGSFSLRPDEPGTGQAEVWMRIENSSFTYPDGSVLKLRKPIFKVEKPYDGDAPGGSRLFASDVKMGARMTPAMMGLGLVEAIPEKQILDLAKRDLSAWGIKGEPNWVLDQVKWMKGQLYPVSLGRFGLKANTPSVLHQSMGALRGDVGITNPYFPDENIAGTPLFEAFKNSWKPGIEASLEIADTLTFYSQTLAVPSRRNAEDPLVQKGAVKFNEVGCALCHHPSFTTDQHEVAALRQQTIFPFSDFLLHDMGEDLADGRTDFRASGRQWKTRPLWGIGVSQVVNPRGGFLHDGRARTLEEAVIWHDGEARRSKTLFSQLPKADRDALILFLKSL